MKIAHLKLETLILQYLIRRGIEAHDANITAKVLVEGSLRGYSNHGVDRLLQIKEGLDNDTIKIKGSYKIIRESIATAVLDAGHKLGQPLGDYAMRLAVKKAEMAGIGIVGTLNATHLGILSYYSEIASQNACLGLVMSTSSPAVVLKGGKIKTLGTNPISYSIPFSPFLLTADFSTSKVSRGTIIQYLQENKKIPMDWAVDSEGIPTQDPKLALKGGIQTIDGNIKGSLLSLLVSIMSGHMLGGVTNPEVSGTRYMHEFSNKGDLFIAIHIPSFTNVQDFYLKTKELCDFITHQNIDFKIPGQGSYKRKQNSILHGIEVSENLMSILNDCKETIWQPN